MINHSTLAKVIAQKVIKMSFARVFLERIGRSYIFNCNNKMNQNKIITYSLLAYINNNDGNSINVLDIFVPLFKRLLHEPTLKSKACLKCLYFTIIIFDLCRYLEYFSYLCTINQTE